MTEQWKDIPGFEGRYEVSNAGGYRNSKTGRVLKSTPYSNRYLRMVLGAGNTFLAHRLVAMAFIPGDWNLQVNHKNGDRADNRAENLEWVTCSENHLHSYANLKRKKHCLTQPVIVGGVRYESELAAAKALGVVAGSIRSALARDHKCKGVVVSYG